MLTPFYNRATIYVVETAYIELTENLTFLTVLLNKMTAFKYH